MAVLMTAVLVVNAGWSPHNIRLLGGGDGLRYWLCCGNSVVCVVVVVACCTVVVVIGSRVVVVTGSRVVVADWRCDWIGMGIAEMLARQGCRITVAGDGFAALCSIEEARPDIIFMDAMMPRLDGFQTCALLRSSEQWRNTPVVLVSAGETLLDQVKAELAGAHRYLQKPFRAAELLQAIGDLVTDARETR